MIRATRLAVALLLALNLAAGPAAANTRALINHAPWDGLLKEHVEPGGWVDYAGVREDRAALDAYVGHLGALRKPHFDSLSDDQRLAILINAYNAFTLQLIIDHWDGGKLQSIRDLHGGNPWDVAKFTLVGQRVTLNDIEHRMIRQNFDEPRIHWAVVCAAYSCPPLRPEAYNHLELESQLADQERVVLAAGDPRFITRDDAGVRVTKLFEWYGSDFGEDWKAYAVDAIRSRVKWSLSASDFAGFLDYDWKLNDVRNKP